jgi:hypothetical protein
MQAKSNENNPKKPPMISMLFLSSAFYVLVLETKQTAVAPIRAIWVRMTIAQAKYSANRLMM